MKKKNPVQKKSIKERKNFPSLLEPEKKYWGRDRCDPFFSPPPIRLFYHLSSAIRRFKPFSPPQFVSIPFSPSLSDPLLTSFLFSFPSSSLITLTPVSILRYHFTHYHHRELGSKVRPCASSCLSA